MPSPLAEAFLMGILNGCYETPSYMWLDYGEYEMYFVIPGNDGRITVSEVIRWQDNYCANTYLNIFSLQRSDDEILTSIHNYENY